MATKVASLFGELSLKDTMTGSLKKASGKLDEIGGNMKKIGGQVTRFGATWTAAFAPVTIGMGLAIRESKNFTSSMLNVHAMLGITGAEADALNAELLAMGASSRQGPQQVADSFYSIVSGVQDASTHMDILTASINLADAGQADLAVTTDGLINVMNAYKFSADQASFASDVFTRTVGMGKGTMDEFVSALAPISGLAKEVGIGFDELGGAMAYLTTQGNTASASSTQLMAIMSAFLKPNAEMTKAIDDMGFSSGAAAIEQEGLIGVLTKLEATTGGVEGTMSAALGTQEALRGSVSLLNDDTSAFIETYTSGIDGVTARTADIQNQNASWDLLGSKMQALMITVGDELVPVLLALMDEVVIPLIDEVIRWTDENPEATQTLILMVGAAALLGPPLMLVGTLITAAGTAAGIAGPLIGALTTPFGAVAAAALAAVAAVQKFNEVLVENRKERREFREEGIASGDFTADEYDAVITNAVQAEIDAANERGGLEGFIVSGMIGTLDHFGYFDDSGENLGESVLDGRAAGGPVGANTPYMVGEEGPELFVPGSSGTIVPNHAMGGGVNIGSVTIHANDDAGGRAAARGFKAELTEIRRRRG